MKRSSIYKTDTSWLLGLLIYSLLNIVLVLASFIPFGIEMAYIADGKPKNTFDYDSVAFPAVFVTTIFQLFCNIYFIWNFVLWNISYTKSSGRRKDFNFIAISVGGFIIVLITLDTLLKLVTSFYGLSVFIDFTGTDPLVVGDKSWNTIFAKPYLLLIVTFIGSIFFGVMFYLQKRWFKSEIDENSLANVQSNYRKLEMDKKRQLIKKQKQKDLSKRIKVF